MARHTQNQINAIDTTRDVLADPVHAAAVASLPGFADEASEFRDERALLQPWIVAAGEATASTTINKDRVRKAASKKASARAGGACVYARKTNDGELETEMEKKSTSFFYKQLEGKLEPELQRLHDRLAPIVDADSALPAPVVLSSNYGITAASLIDLQSAADSVSLVEHGPRAKQVEIGAAKAQVEEQVKALMEQIDSPRRLLPQLEEAYPAFVEALRSAMIIRDTVAHHAAKKTSGNGTS